MADGMPAEVTLSTPRMVLLNAAGQLAGETAANLLVGFLRSWHIPVHVFAPPGGPVGPGGPPPMASERHADLGGLFGTRWAPAAMSTADNGGDFTLVLSQLDGPLELVLEFASVTSTPVLLLLPAAEDLPDVDRLVDRLLAASCPIAGFVLAEPAGKSSTWIAQDPGSHVRHLGLADRGRVPAMAGTPRAGGSGTTAPSLMDVEWWDGAARTFDLAGLLESANQAPHLVEHPPAASGGQPINRVRPGVAAGRSPIPRRDRPAERRAGRTLMVVSTHSSAGKSLVVAGLARHFADLGLRVAPFKGQNMSNNARVVTGGEMSSAQYYQALAARAEPDVRMNPVLLKPLTGRSHVILNGRAAPALTALPWRLRKPLLWPAVRASLDGLRAENDLVIIEGAGGVAEGNLLHNDIVNMRVALAADAPTLLVTDAGQGGGVADCYGTWLLLPGRERAQLRGWIFNRFFHRSHACLLKPDVEHLQHLTGVPSLGILPQIPHRIPDEDMHNPPAEGRGMGTVVAVVCYPNIANFDEFAVLDGLPGVRLTWARDAAAVRHADLVVLPGSRHVAADLTWLHQFGIDRAVQDSAAAGTPVLGICGGLQMLGDSISDPDGVEGSAPGLGLLPLRTVLKMDKLQAETETRFADRIPNRWGRLAGLTVRGYEIRHGVTSVEAATRSSTVEALPGGRGFAGGAILGVYLHGLFENPAVTEALFGNAGDHRAELDESFDRVGAALRECLDMAAIEAMAC